LSTLACESSILFTHSLLIFSQNKTPPSPDKKLTFLTGSFDYIVPKVIKNTGYGKPVDIWWTSMIECIDARMTSWLLSLCTTIITCALLCGYLPSRADNVITFAQQNADFRSNFRVGTKTLFLTKPNPLSDVSPLPIRSIALPPMRLYETLGLLLPPPPPTHHPTSISPSSSQLES